MAESESSEQEVVGCAREDCTVVEDGKCLEGLSLEECPHVNFKAKSPTSSNGHEPRSPEGASHSSKESVAGKEKARDVERGGVNLHDGTSLSLSETRTITTSALARIVVLAGMAESGKTTLLACLSEMYQRGPYAGHVFAGSRTLPAFEKRCHLARVRSNREEADTPRTPRDEGAKFVHLRLREKNLSSPPQEVLLSDIHGELFQSVRDSSTEAQRLEFLNRTDHFALLVDGAKLLDPAQRASAQAGARGILRRLIDEKLLGTASFVDVLFTKWDLIKDAGESEREKAKEMARRIRAGFNDKFSDDVERLRFFQVAARPEPGSDIEQGYGIEDLFRSWIEDTPLLSKPSLNAEDHATNQREFSKFSI